MKMEKVKPQNLEEVAKEWGIVFQVFKIKFQLIDSIRKYCSIHKISQRKLASIFKKVRVDPCFRRDDIWHRRMRCS